MVFVGKIVMLTFSDAEEKAVEKAIAALADRIPLEAIQPPHSPGLLYRDWKSDYTNAGY